MQCVHREEPSGMATAAVPSRARVPAPKGTAIVRAPVADRPDWR